MRAPTAPIAPEHELALLLAGTEALRERHRARALALTERVEPDALEAFLLRAGVLSLLGRRLERLVGDALPAGFRARLDAHAAQAQRQGVGQELLTVRLLAALGEAGIRALPLKGPLLGERLHGAAGARISADVDLLVAPGALPRAVDVVCGLGYRVEPPREPGDATAPTLHERLVHPDGLPDVELHWRVHWYETRFSTELLAESATGADGCLVPRREDELAMLLLIYARDGFAGLRLACDLAAWWDRYGDELGPRGVSATATAHPETARALATATVVAERLVGLPARRVLDPGLLGTASPPAARLANWPLRGAAGQISANVSLADWLMAPHGQWSALVRRNVLLSRRELRSRWPEADAGPLARTRLRLLHAARVISRYAIATWTLRGGRTWTPLPSSPGAFDGR
ncbi:MAG TPA: nucleotidyltransferase family protein [Conexibacter sp.]|nr:nucleotidyltransferase family protein [Conexibacter sp.]